MRYRASEKREIIDRENFRVQRCYFHALRDEILSNIVEGRSLAEIRKLVTMDEYRDYGRFDLFLDQNIVTM